MNARHIGKNLRWGYIALATLVSLLIAAAIHSPTAGALGLPSIAQVELPIENTVLDSVISPVTEATNKLLPVTITSTPSTLGAQVTLPLGGNSAQPPSVNASVDIPVVPQVVNAVTDAATRPSGNMPSSPGAPSLRTTPLQEVPQTAPSPDATVGQTDQQGGITTAKAPTGSTRASASQTAKANEPALPFSPVIFGVANFLGGGIPGGVQTLMEIGKDHPVNLMPIVASLVIFIVTIAALFGTIYVIDHTSIVRFGSGRVAQFAQAHDLAQITSVIIVMIGAALVTAFLVMKPF